MALARSFLVAAASVVLLDSTARASDPVTLKLAEVTSCLTNINEARQEAGLTILKGSTDLVPEDSTFQSAGKAPPEGLWSQVCTNLLGGVESKAPKSSTTLGTYAFFGLGEVEEQKNLTEIEPQCSAAVEKWQKGFSSFEADPPAGKKVEYNDVSPDQVSFVTLYNPVSEAKGQCAVATCKSSLPSRNTTKLPAALVCFTGSNAFNQDPLYTEDQWNKIRKAFGVNSASVAAPYALALATALAAAFLF
nr:suface antigen 11 [Eimeria magna]